MRSLGLAVAFVLAGPTSPCLAVNAGECPSDINRAQLALGYAEFDAAGWRDLLMSGCTDAAVAQLVAYRDANRARISEDQAREINFHIGQALAMAGRDQESISHFEEARGGDAEWSAYVEATLAFLRRDAGGLQTQRDRYAAASGASEMRLRFIDGFIACPAAGYREAVHCAMAH